VNSAAHNGVLGGQLLSLLLICECLAKVFVDTKRRPLYFSEAVAAPEQATSLPVGATVGAAASGRTAALP
jgi:hypothetical protein